MSNTKDERPPVDASRVDPLIWVDPLVRRLTAHIQLLRQLLAEADSLLVEHHSASFTVFSGDCPVCCRDGRVYPHDIFGRIENALIITDP